MFALGVLVCRQRFRQDTNWFARERFYRALRACCDRGGLGPPFV